MNIAANPQLSVSQRSRARRLAYYNGAIWAVGSGLISSMLIVYLAMEFDVPGIGLWISLILAAPRIAGLLRMAAPALIGRLAGRKAFCLTTYLLSAVVLFGIPLAAAPGVLPSARHSLAALVLLWCVYHLLEYLGTVALWSWLADLVPLRIRGRFLGRRERWMVTGQAVAMLATGGFSFWWNRAHADADRWIGYALPAAVGACLMIAAVVPLAKMPEVAVSRAVRLGATLRQMAAPLADARFLRLVLFGCWFSLSNGVTQFSQSVYPNWVLGIGLYFMLAVKVGMRTGQFAISPWMGRLADRVGNRPVMLACLPVVASGPLFYFLSGAEQPAWASNLLVAGAWAAWIAYAGLNVCLPNLMLKLSPDESNTPYIATYFSISGLCLAVGTIVGGTAFDWFRDTLFVLPGSTISLDYYHFSFLFGWITRTMGVLLLLLIIEPNTNPKRKRGPQH